MEGFHRRSGRLCVESASEWCERTCSRSRRLGIAFVTVSVGGMGIVAAIFYRHRGRGRESEVGSDLEVFVVLVLAAVM